MTEKAKLKDISMYYNNILKLQPTSGVNISGLKLVRPFIFSVLLFIVLLLTGCQSGSPTKTSNNVTSNFNNKSQPSEKQLATYQSALTLLNNKNYLNADKILLNLSQELPEFSGLWINLGLSNLLQKKPVIAEKYLNKALVLSPEIPQTLNLMGLLATHNRQVKSAEDYYKKAIKQDGNYSNAHYNLALLYDIYLQDTAKAITHYRRYLTLIENNDKITLSWLEQLEASLKQ